MDVEIATDADWKGVCFNKRARRWQASIHIQKRYVYLGCYATRAQAAKAWDLVSLRVRHNTRTNLSRDDYFDQHGNLLSCPVLDDMIQVFLSAEQQPEGAAPDQTARGAFCAAVAQAVTGVPAPSDVPAAAAQRGAVAKRRRNDPGSTSEPQAAAVVKPRIMGMQQQRQQLLQEQQQQQQLLQQELLCACLPQQAPAQAGAAAGGTAWCGAVTSPVSSAGPTPSLLGSASSSPAASDTMAWQCGQPAAPAWAKLAAAPQAAAPPAAAPPAAAPAPFNLPRARLPATRHGRPQLPTQHQTHQRSGGSSAKSRQLAATLVEQMLGALPEQEQNQLLRDLLGMEPPAATSVAVAAAQTPAAGTTGGATAAATGRGAADTAACSAMPHPGAPAGGHQPDCAAGADTAAALAGELASALVTCNSSSSSGSSGQFGQAGQQQQQQQQQQTQVFNTRLLQGLLPPGSSIEQIRVAGGGIGMFSVMFACWTSSPVAWGAQIWDGVCWHGLGTYGCEADAVAASVYVMESVSDACSV